MLACMYFMDSLCLFHPLSATSYGIALFTGEKNTNRGQNILTLGGYLAYISGIYFGRSSWDLAASVVLEKRASVC